MATGDGKINIKGGVALALNPPPPEKEGATYNGTSLKIEYDDEGKLYFVRVFGWATYLDAFGNERQVTHHVDLDDPGLEALKPILAQVLEAYAPSMKNSTMDEAYKSRQVALHITCPVCNHRPEHKPGECRSEGCKCTNVRGGK